MTESESLVEVTVDACGGQTVTVRDPVGGACLDASTFHGGMIDVEVTWGATGEVYGVTLSAKEWRAFSAAVEEMIVSAEARK